MSAAATFDIHIPREQIGIRPRPHAQHRLMRFDRAAGQVTHHAFADIGQALPPNALIVINNSRVVKAALRLNARADASLQILNPAQMPLTGVAVAAHDDVDLHDEVAVAGGRFRPRERGAHVVLGDLIPDDPAIATLPDYLDRYGAIPLPTYVASERVPHDLDENDFQTCYARVPGSLSCPTAGLHFTPELMAHVEQIGHTFAEITLHIGYGSWDSFEGVDSVDLNAERLIVTRDVLQTLWHAKRDGRPIVAVGTTCVRTLETLADDLLGAAPPQHDIARTTDLLVTPSYTPRVVDALLTDFAYPQTPVMLMSAAFAGLDALTKLYQTAIDSGYRFDIFGDALLLS